MSVSFLCSTFAVSGIRFAATRLVSEEMGKSARRCEQGNAALYCLQPLFGISAMVILLRPSRISFSVEMPEQNPVLDISVSRLSYPTIRFQRLFHCRRRCISPPPYRWRHCPHRPCGLFPGARSRRNLKKAAPPLSRRSTAEVFPF